MLFLCNAVFALGCGGGCSGSGSESSTGPTARSSDDTTPTRDTEGHGGESVASEPDVMPIVRLLGDVDPHARRVGIRIENRGTEEAALRGELALQRQDRGGWEDFSSDVDLRFDCDARPPECARLAPGGVLIPPPWLGTEGRAQCSSERGSRAPAGTYRFVARSCGGTHAIEGEPFQLP
jgi:hypothetical protein